MTAYAEYLAPRLDQAARAVAVPPESWAKESAERLSELAFRAMSDDTDAPADRQAEGLAAYWLARDLIPLTGEWADRLHAAERTAELVEKIGPNGRSRANALVVVFQVLLDSSPLLAPRGRGRRRARPAAGGLPRRRPDAVRRDVPARAGAAPAGRHGRGAGVLRGVAADRREAARLGRPGVAGRPRRTQPGRAPGRRGPSGGGPPAARRRGSAGAATACRRRAPGPSGGVTR